MESHSDPATVALARGSAAFWKRLRGYLAGRPAVQLKDLWIEAGIDPARYADNIHMKLHHAERLIRLGYRPVAVPALSGALAVAVFVREPWPEDEHFHPRLAPYLEDGDPLMALLVGRVQRDMRLAELIEKEPCHGRT